MCKDEIKWVVNKYTIASHTCNLTYMYITPYPNKLSLPIWNTSTYTPPPKKNVTVYHSYPDMLSLLIIPPPNHHRPPLLYTCISTLTLTCGGSPIPVPSINTWYGDRLYVYILRKHKSRVAGKDTVYPRIPWLPRAGLLAMRNGQGPSLAFGGWKSYISRNYKNNLHI